ncbi:MAG: Dabb family protein [Actinomycetota bacterium]|nr:Dabb family protein [Actinomycetota bacterium]
MFDPWRAWPDTSAPPPAPRPHGVRSKAARKNAYRFGISIEFADRAAYEGYNDHPDHVRFVQECWLSEVSDFLEPDYAAR